MGKPRAKPISVGDMQLNNIHIYNQYIGYVQQNHQHTFYSKAIWAPWPPPYWKRIEFAPIRYWRHLCETDGLFHIGFLGYLLIIYGVHIYSAVVDGDGFLLVLSHECQLRMPRWEYILSGWRIRAWSIWALRVKLERLASCEFNTGKQCIHLSCSNN